MGEEVNSPKTDDEDDLSHLFTVDNNPTAIADDLDIPQYSSKFSVLKEKVEEPEIIKTRAKPAGISCWNCGGSHNLRDCTERRNHGLIAQKRAESLLQRQGKASRYHTDDEQRYAHLQPGKLSEATRDALGLRPDQVPLHVYRMRQLGYPPGWVEEAKISHSGLSMFDSQGQEVKDPDLEDGEIVSKEDRDKYDTRKLIEYPGFNVPFEEGTVDETTIYGALPMRETQSIKHMLRLWSGKKMGAYKRRKLAATTATPSGSDSPAVRPQAVTVENEDMEVDAEEEGELRLVPPTDDCRFIPPLPDSTPVKPPPPPTPPEETPQNSPQTTAVKRKLTSDEDSPAKISKLETSTNDQLEDDASSKIPKLETSTIDQLEDDAKKCSEEDTTESNDVASPSLDETFNGRVTSVISGTPVISRSEFKYLPAPEKFSKDICDVINFENLPNSTGKYEQMRGLVQKVREYVTLSLKSDEGDEDPDD